MAMFHCNLLGLNWVWLWIPALMRFCTQQKRLQLRLMKINLHLTIMKRSGREQIEFWWYIYIYYILYILYIIYILYILYIYIYILYIYYIYILYIHILYIQYNSVYRNRTCKSVYHVWSTSRIVPIQPVLARQGPPTCRNFSETLWAGLYPGLGQEDWENGCMYVCLWLNIYAICLTMCSITMI